MPNSTTNYSFNLPLVNNATDADLWGGQLNSNWTSLDSLLLTATNAGVPIGFIGDYAGTTAPSLWLLCYGQTIGNIGSGAVVENAGSATVFDIVKVAYGNAGTESFASGGTVLMPDRRGRVSAGQDDMGGVSANRLTGASGGVDGDTLGAAGGVETVTLAQANVPSYNLTIPTQTTTGAVGTQAITQGSAASNSSVSISSGGSGSAHNNVQPTIIFNTIMFMGA